MMQETSANEASHFELLHPLNASQIIFLSFLASLTQLGMTAQGTEAADLLKSLRSFPTGILLVSPSTVKRARAKVCLFGHRMTNISNMCVEKKNPNPAAVQMAPLILLSWVFWKSCMHDLHVADLFKSPLQSSCAANPWGEQRWAVAHPKQEKQKSKKKILKGQKSADLRIREVDWVGSSPSGNMHDMHCKNIHQVSCKTPNKSQHAHLLSFRSLWFFAVKACKGKVKTSLCSFLNLSVAP